VEKVIQVLNGMQADRVVEKYAIGGGIAALYYLEPYLTDDIDVFVSPVIIGQAGIVSLEPIYSYLQKLGYLAVREGVMIDEWLVQFIPTFSPLQEEAISQSLNVSYGVTNTYIFSPEHLAAELLRSGRLKDQVRVIALIEGGRVDMSKFRAIVERHGLADAWTQFAAQFNLEA